MALIFHSKQFVVFFSQKRNSKTAIIILICSTFTYLSNGGFNNIWREHISERKKNVRNSFVIIRFSQWKLICWYVSCWGWNEQWSFYTFLNGLFKFVNDVNWVFLLILWENKSCSLPWNPENIFLIISNPQLIFRFPTDD